LSKIEKLIEKIKRLITELDLNLNLEEFNGKDN
jgi:hypothetical protein